MEWSRHTRVKKASGNFLCRNQVIDVRSEEERAEGHIPGSRNLPTWEGDLGEFHDKVDSLVEEFAATEKTLVFHCAFSLCRGPSCARLMEKRLKEQKPDHRCKVRILRGGWVGWQLAQNGGCFRCCFDGVKLFLKDLRQEMCASS